MSESLPTVDAAFVEGCRKEYEQCGDSAPKEYEAARLRYVWALVHSSKASHYELGRSLANAQRSSDASPRDYRYLEAVAMYKMRDYIEARREVNSLLQEQPGFRQAGFLKGLIEDALVTEGLVGVGVVGAVAGAALLVAGLLLGARKH